MIKLQLRPERRILRQFAFAAPFGYALIGWALCYKLQWLPQDVFWVFLGIGLLATVAFFVGLSIVTLNVFRLTMLAAYPVGLVLFPLVLGLVFYGVITPMALVMRLIGRDALHRKLDPSAKTYWHDRGQARPASSYFKLY
jgi:hypothetical protein